MSKKIIFILVIIILGIWLFSKSSITKNNLTSPESGNVTNTPLPISKPPVAPKSLDFNAQTDLNAELEKVNPEVLDSDFSE